ncbi:MAG: Hsp70 family protein [Bryobacteraceae bacterium]
MRLGIDFGTTRIVVAVADRGNYPVVSFDTEDGGFEWFPSMVAVRGSEQRFGWDAWAAQAEPDWTVIRSIKRLLDDAGPDTRIDTGGSPVPMMELLAALCDALRVHIIERSSLTIGAGEPLEIMLGVPANANSNQRFLTVEAFRRAGFSVLGLLNEPSAASIEYGHRNRAAGGASGRLLVYDFGGGTFDTSLVEMADKTHSVAATEGIASLGGDDFDEVLGGLALATVGAGRDELTPPEAFRLIEECRAQKETLNPNSRKLVVGLAAVREGWGEAAVAVTDFYEMARPLLEETLRAVDELLAAHGGDEVEAVYLTGGASELPLVARMLKERFGRKVKRSPYTRSATAIGLAIQADEQSGYVLRERFTRNFGVWREADAGQRMVFDVLFERGTKLPGPGEIPLAIVRQYEPVHNIGHFRYLEASHVAQDGQPAGDIAVWDEILFPFDPILEPGDLARMFVRHLEGPPQRIEERFTCDSTGTVTAALSNLTAGYSREFRLGRWASKESIVVPGSSPRAAAKRKARSGK